jgi:HD superfamily phosphohydrolase
MAELALRKSDATGLIEKSSFSVNELVDSVNNGASLRGVRLDLIDCPVNPGLVDMLERDAYFAGVEYAQLEFRRLFDSTRIAKNKVAVERGALFTLESYLSAAANMFDAVYYHKTVRAAELMLLRVLDEAGSSLFRFPRDDPSGFFGIDDITFDDHLLRLPSDATEGTRAGSRIFEAFRWRSLIKLASSRTVIDPEFLEKIQKHDGRYQIETEIAEAADVDPAQVFVDYPARKSVTFWPGRFRFNDLVLFERGSKGYEFWHVDDMSLVARSIGRNLMLIRIYTTKGYRAKVRKKADSILEAVDGVGEVA